MNKVSILVLLYFVILISVACQDQVGKEGKVDNSDPILFPSAPLSQLGLGYRLLEKNCFSCHNATADQGSRIAPPMEYVKRAYRIEYHNLEHFTMAISKFVSKPELNLSLMPEAIEQYGLMPKMSFTEEEIQALCEYVYNEQLDYPDWMNSQEDQ